MVAELPRTIGKYIVLGELGRGATSIVYRGKDPFASREVAIKVFHPEAINNPIERARFSKLFVKEASIAGKLNHPHIVNIYDAVVDANEQSGYIVMEMVRGSSLDEYAIQDKLLPTQTVMQLIFKCCTALDFAAKQGIIHRDIKPANIMYHPSGEIKITDFGAALMMDKEQTQAEGIGSPAYMSPEQIENKELSHQTDIYSLGVVMYKLLTGRIPYDADNTYALMHKIVNEPPIHIQDLRHSLPDTIAAIVHRAMEKDTSKRYPEWADFVGDLAASVMPASQSSKNLADSEKFGMLKPLEFFSEFTDVELWELIRISQWAKFPTGKLLMKEGDVGSSFYMLMDGEVYVTKMGKMITSLTKGDCFGEMAYIDKQNARRSASIISGTPVILIKIKSSALEEASNNLQLKFNKMFLKTLVRRLAYTNTELASLVA